MKSNFTSPDQLLLSEGVCCQQHVDIITYHAEAQEWRKGYKRGSTPAGGWGEAKVPTVQVRLVGSVHVPPQQWTLVQIRVDTCGGCHPVYVECDPHFEDVTGLCVDDALLSLGEDGLAHMIVKNSLAHTQVA